MEAKELKLTVGNFVHIGGLNTQVAEIFDDGITTTLDGHQYEYLYKFIEPIPLTEEWLIDFRFNRINKGIGWDEFSDGKLILVEVPTNKGKLIAFNYATDKYKYLRYVHELQILYVALTGEELQRTKTE